MVLELWLKTLGKSVKTAWKRAAASSSSNRGGGGGGGGGVAGSKCPKIGVLAFEVGNLMSKLILLWQSLSDSEIVRLREEVMNMEGVRRLVANDEALLLWLACAEKLDTLSELAEAVGRLGRKCTDPALQGFLHVYQDLLADSIEARSLAFSAKEMDAKIRKMEKYIGATANLYQELEVLADLEQTLRRLQGSAENPGKDGGGSGTGTGTAGAQSVQQKFTWHKHEVKYLREVSLWNRSYDSVVGLLARTVFTIFARIRAVFGPDLASRRCGSDPASASVAAANANAADSFSRSLSVSVSASGPMRRTEKPELRFASGPLERSSNIEMSSGRRFVGPVLNRLGSRKVWNDKSDRIAVRISKSGSLSGSGSPARFSKDSSGVLKVNGNGFSSFAAAAAASQVQVQAQAQSPSPSPSPVRSSSVESALRSDFIKFQGFFPADCSSPAVEQFHSSWSSSSSSSGSFYASKFKLLNAPSSTLGGAALALHYANVIIIIEKLVRFPHLIGPDARDDLYQMLPTSVRRALRSKLKAYAKNMSSGRYNAGLAADWNDALGKILEWLAPLAHNMIRWQSERNFEQQHMMPRTNVVLLQTLYFANQAKTELAITELLVGLNYICRYEQEIRASAIMECTSGHDYDEYLEWQM